MKHEQILVVDDSQLSRMMIKGFTLAAHPNWEVIEANDGLEALEKVKDKDITWMTIDYNMPGMDGLTLAVKLQTLYPNANIALLTANIQDSIRAQASELGISYIQKPITESKIRAYVEG